MAKQQIEALLWRRVNKATYDSLKGFSQGQYDIRLGGTPDYRSFFKGVEPTNQTQLGGFELPVVIAAFEGDPPVAESTITVRYMGPESARQDWYIRAQRPESAYELWRPGRGFPSSYQHSDKDSPYIFIARTVDGRFHARMVSYDDLDGFPESVQRLFRSDVFGIRFFAKPSASDLTQEIYEDLLMHHNVLLYGPPGTGKTTLMQQVRELFEQGAKRLYLETTLEKQPISEEQVGHAKTLWVTFHQSYSYEQFVVGLRTEDSSESLLSLKPAPGILLELSEHARTPGNLSLLLIDEINRGDVSRIFGEFITLLEPDKRLGPDGNPSAKTVMVRLPHMALGATMNVQLETGPRQVTNPFTMPYHVYTLASMNSVDKTVAPLDSALRRRFYVRKLLPDYVLLAQRLGLAGFSVPHPLRLPSPITSTPDYRKLALALLVQVNEGIIRFLGSEFTLGHSYLWDLGTEDAQAEPADAVRDRLFRLWDTNILPQLEELFYGRTEQLAYVIKARSDSNLYPYRLVDPTEDELELGAAPKLEIKHRALSGDDGAQVLRAIAGVQVLREGAEQDAAQV
jgi:DNA polymerase III delta prime subunit